MTDHFQLDVDPDTLTTVQGRLETLAEHLRTKGGEVTQTPGEIGDQWTGGAADTIKGEMTGLGTLMKGFATNVDAIAVGAKNLAKDYQDALDDLPRINRLWQEAEDDYTAAIAAANVAHTEGTEAASTDGGQPNTTDRNELNTIRAGARVAAFEARRETQHDLEISFGYTRQWLAYQTQGFSDILVEQTPVNVPDSALEDLEGGTLPTSPFDHTGLLAGLQMTRDYEQNARDEAEQQAREESQQQAADDLEELEELTSEVPVSDEEALMDLLERMGGRADDTDYSEAVVRELGPDGLNDVISLLEDNRTMQSEQLNDTDLEALRHLNDVAASGLSQYEDAELTDFVDQFGGPFGMPSRVLLMLESTHADTRLNGLGLQYVHRMGELENGPGSPAADFGRDYLTTVWPGGKDEIVQTLVENSDASDMAELINNVGGERAQYLAEALMDDNWNGEDGPESNEAWNARMEFFNAILGDAVDRELTGTVEGFLVALDRSDTGRGEDVDNVFQGYFEDPDFIRLLAENQTYIDQEAVSRAASRVLGDVDMEQLLEDLTAQGLGEGEGDVKVADDLGYLLGLADVAGTEVDMGGVTNAILSAMVGAGPGAAVTGPTLSIFTALMEANAEADAAHENYGENWSKERQHEMLAWLINVGSEGPPPGYETWLEDNQDRFPPDEPDAAVILYLQELRSAPRDSPEYERWLEIEALQEQLGETRRIGGN